MATGGTISNRDGDRLTAEDLVKSMPRLDRYVRPEFEQFANVASNSLTLTQWVALARRINTLFKEDRDLSGIVVTSGTDTLEETAYFLNLTVRSDKPVVVVGSMRNPSTLGYEGAANLLEAYRVAASPSARERRVRRDDDAHWQRAHRRERHPGAGIFPHPGGRPRAHQGAHPADARADQDDRGDRDSADVHAVLAESARPGCVRTRSRAPRKHADVRKCITAPLR